MSRIWVTDGKRLRWFYNEEQSNGFLRRNPSWYLGKLPHTSSTKKKISDSTKGRKGSWLGKHLSQEHKEKDRLSHLGKVHSDSAKIKMSESHIGSPGTNKGRKFSDEWRSNLSKSLKGNKNALGFHHTEATKLYLSEVLTKAAIEHPEIHQSNLENYIISYLRNYFKVIPQFRIDKEYNHPYDMLIYLPNGIKLLLEVDGLHWHSNETYGWSLAKDKYRESYARSKGFEFLVITDEEFKQFKGLKYVKSKVSKYYPELNNLHLNSQLC